MNTPLRSLRSQSAITQADLSFLLERNNNGGISSVEQGKVTPTLRILLLYHLIFQTPIETLVQGYREHMRIFLAERLPLRIEALRNEPEAQLRTHRIAHLEEALKSLTASPIL